MSRKRSKHKKYNVDLIAININFMLDNVSIFDSPKFRLAYMNFDTFIKSTLLLGDTTFERYIYFAHKQCN